MATNATTATATTTTTTATATASSTTNTSTGTSTTSDVTTNLSNLLPTGTFLAFQALAPLFTNDGKCGLVEKILTFVLVLTFCIIVVILTFTDSLTTTGGKHYYGFVACKGLWNPEFKRLGFTNGSSFYKGNPSRYVASIYDVINAVLGVVVFAVLVVLTPPVTTCFYPRLSSTIVKAVPILVGLVVALYFSFAPPPRRGVGYSVVGLVTEPVDDSSPVVPDGSTGTSSSGTRLDTTTATTAAKSTSDRTSAPAATTDEVQLEDLGTDPSKETLLTRRQRAIHSATPSPEHYFSSVV